MPIAGRSWGSAFRSGRRRGRDAGAERERDRDDPSVEIPIACRVEVERNARIALPVRVFG